MADFQDTIKEKFNSFLSSANTLRQSATDTIKEGLETGKEKLQEWDRDRRANDIYQNLGKKIYKLSNRGEIELPECCDKYIQALNELYADDEAEENDEDAFRVIKLYNPNLSEMTKKDEEYFLAFLSDLPKNTCVIFWFYEGQEDALSKAIYKKLLE